VWGVLSNRQYKHIVFGEKMLSDEYYSAAHFGYKHNMTMSDFYFARDFDSMTQAHINDWHSHVDNDSIYLFLPKSSNYHSYSSKLYFYASGYYIMGTLNPLVGCEKSLISTP
jgi:hypothetical protein